MNSGESIRSFSHPVGCIPTGLTKEPQRDGTPAVYSFTCTLKSFSLLVSFLQALQYFLESRSHVSSFYPELNLKVYLKENQRSSPKVLHTRFHSQRSGICSGLHMPVRDLHQKV